MSETTGLTIPEMLDRILENQCALPLALRNMRG